MARYRTLTLLVLAASLLTGCGAHEGSKRAPSAANEIQWVLIENPMFEAPGDEPEYIWVEEDKIPSSPNTLIFGKKSVLAPPEVVANHEPPPGGGKISRLHLRPPQPSRAETALRPSAARRPPGSGRPVTQETALRGYVVYVDEQQIVVDLTSVDGLKQGSILSLRRGSIPLRHPVTGQYLGELDQEIGTARVIEIREQFSVAVIREIRPGIKPRVKDRVVIKPE